MFHYNVPMRILWPFLLLALGLPVLEAGLLIWLGAHYGWGWLFLYLALSALLGTVLLRLERKLRGIRLLAALQAGGNPLAALFASGRMMLAGLLFILPGVISDLGAVLLLLMPGTWRRPPRPPGPQDNVIDAEFRRLEDPRLPDRRPPWDS